ncbi:MAG: hypothetical protein M3139_18045 [Bacteroidota bacterium]|nr:hypothetical protein [Bacteroidota bacterium]
MYTLFKNIPTKKILSIEFPALGVSLLMAETFYKFGSFTLECCAFLLTWYGTSFIMNMIFMKLRKDKKHDNPGDLL